MNTINSSSLFHFTKDVDSLKSILQNGFRLSYCMEKYNKDMMVGLPMICFCDIPLMRTQKHRTIYGDYTVGVSKEKLRKKYLFELNPVLYRNSIYVNRIVNEAVKQLSFHNEESQKILNSVFLDNFDKMSRSERFSVYGNEELERLFIENGNKVKFYESLIAYSKLYNEGEKVYYDESEWRIVGNNWNDTIWLWTKCNDNGEELRKTENIRLWKAKDIYYQVSSINDITHIIVNKEKEVFDIVEFIMQSEKIMNIIISEEDKKLLLTKITSLERIENDY